MARLIEIKGLGAEVASVKKGIGQLRVAAAELNHEGRRLKAEMDDLAEQIREHRHDLRFEAEMLGNSAGAGDDEPPAKPEATKEETKEVAGSGVSSDSFPVTGDAPGKAEG